MTAAADGAGETGRGRSVWRWLAPVIATLTPLLLASHRSAKAHVLFRWSGHWTMVILCFVVLALVVWWTALSPRRSAAAMRRLQRITVRDVAVLLPLFAVVVGFAGLLGRPAALAMAAFLACAFVLGVGSQRPGRTMAVLFWIVVVGLIGGETTLYAVRHSPSLARSHPFVTGIARLIYRSDTVQLVGESRYDPQLSYTLQPNAEWRFVNTEFDTHYATNSLGLRDDEESLRAPEVVVIGDSYAMGWGVEHAETFAQVIEELTGKKVLNAGTWSYATARSVAALQRFDLSNMKYLVVQVCDNDYTENKRFADLGDKVPILEQHRFDQQGANAAAQVGYYPFKYTLWTYEILPDVLAQSALVWQGGESALLKKDDASRSPATEAEYFLNVMTHAPVDLSGAQLITLQINAWNSGSFAFLSELRGAIAEGRYPAHIANMRVIDISPALDDEDWFALDSHLTASGHRKIAEQVAGQIE